MAMTEFRPPTRSLDQGWLDLRERLARAAREIHFSAVSDETNHGAMLLTIAGNLAALAMSIPGLSARSAARKAPTPLVESTTLLNTQILKDRPSGTRRRATDF
jgi:hypothetical protein